MSGQTQVGRAPRAKTREGLVVSNKSDKTIVVSVKRRVKHRRYHKYIQLSSKFMAHDERNECEIGDRVVIAESRPLSARKRWRLREIVERAVGESPAIDDRAAESGQGQGT